jgi:alanine racemase
VKSVEVTDLGAIFQNVTLSAMNFLDSVDGKRPTWAEVDLNRLDRNFLALRRFLPGHVKIVAVIKADAYGHGAIPVARRLTKLGVDMLAVAILEEAMAIRHAGIRCPVLLLNGFWPGQEHEIIRYELTPAIYRLQLLDQLEQAASRAKRSVAYHLKINTGMSRLGVELEEALVFLQRGAKSSWTRCEGLYTHLSSAEDSQSRSNEAQIGRFRTILTFAEQSGIRVGWRHAANSAGILNLKESWFDAVRPGLVLYGINPLPTPAVELSINPVLSWKTRVMQVRSIKSGSAIGYGDTYTVSRDSVIAALPVGYTDGLLRSLSNRGQVLIQGRQAPIVGTISMDLTLIDVTQITSPQVGDEVVLIGKQGDREIRAEEVGRLAGTIPYEILCRIGSRVPRIYIDDSGSSQI